MQHSQQAQFFPDPSLPPGQGDLEALERLKDTIKNNQHEVFRAIPRPAALASLYKGPLPFRVPPHPEQIPGNLPEKPTTTPSGVAFEKMASSNFIDDAHHAHGASPAQGALSSGGPGYSSLPSRPCVSSSTASSSPADLRDQIRSTAGRMEMQPPPDETLRPVASQFRSASEDAMGVNGSSIAVDLGTNPPPRQGADSTFNPRETSRRDSASDTQQVQPQLLSSPERRRPGPDNEYGTARHTPYTADRERPPSRDVRPYDRQRDWEKEYETERTHERDREGGRDRRWSLSDHRRVDLDRRPSDYERRPPGYDRRSLPNDDRRPPHVEDKRPPSFVDRRLLDDRRILDYERRPLSEENRPRNVPSRDLPQEPHLGNETRPGEAQAMKTHASAPLTSSAPSPGVAVSAPVSAPVDPAADRIEASDHQPTGSSSVPMTSDSQRVTTPSLVAPLEGRSSHMSSLHEPISVTHPQLVSRVEPIRPGLFLEERLSKPLENPSISPASLPSTNQPLNNLSHARVSEPLHAVDSRPVLNGDRERYSLPAADERTRPVSAYSRAPDVGRDESRLISQHPPPPPPTSTPPTVSSAQSSISLHTREPSYERPPNFRPYFRSEVFRPSEDDRRLDVHSLPPSDSTRRYDERGRLPHYGERRGYREYHDRDRVYWASKDRTRDRLPPPPQAPPSHWDRERPRYPELSYTGIEKRFVDRDQGNHRWYPPSYDDLPRRPLDTFTLRGRPRSPGSPNREFTEMRPPPLKRARDDAYGVTGEAYYPRPHHPSPPPSSLNKDPVPLPLPPGPTPVPIPIPRPASPPPPLRYNHHRPPPVEMYGETYGGYERDGGRGPTGPGYSREGPR
ncbi:hypothetical protein BJV78DRAFT_1283892 [Lactifluus subvellereus]|nr:hypothetical protein BJV78DRAFT_1283892 [Lactifluus subvellereus]